MKDLTRRLGLVADPQAKTEAYYSRSPAPAFGAEDVEVLKARLGETGGSTVRVCLHEDSAATFHEMIIVHRRGGDFPQHKHLEKDESYHMIEGVLRIEIYDEDGRQTEVFRIGGIGSGLQFFVRVRRGLWHRTVPETEFAVFHESRPGPFRGGDSIFRHG